MSELENTLTTVQRGGWDDPNCESFSPAHPLAHRDVPFILARAFQISYACLGRGGQGCPILRASSEHGDRPGYPLPFSVFCRPALFMTIRRKITQSPNITGIDLNKIPFLQNAQKDCPARPQRVKAQRRTLWGARCDE